jgi:uncharacterized protein YndB with AHSA1/START domain
MSWEGTAGAGCAAPPERVWAVLLDGRRWSEWNHGVQWMTVEGPLRPGGVLTMKPKGVPQTAFRIEAVVPNRLLALALRVGPLATLRLRWNLAVHAEGTWLEASVATSGPFAGLLLARAARRIGDALPANLERLAACAGADRAGAAILQADNASPSQWGKS